jgi:4-hydroxyphenylpyruvate dioxygenase-like putative hemolysin
MVDADEEGIYCKYSLNQCKIDQPFFEIIQRMALKALVPVTSKALFESEREQELRENVVNDVFFCIMKNNCSIDSNFNNDVLNFFY